MAKITYTDSTGVHTINGVELDEGVQIADISNETEWTLTTIDDTPATYTLDHIGGRPDDR